MMPLHQREHAQKLRAARQLHLMEANEELRARGSLAMQIPWHQHPRDCHNYYGGNYSGYWLLVAHIFEPWPSAILHMASGHQVLIQHSAYSGPLAKRSMGRRLDAGTLTARIVVSASRTCRPCPLAERGSIRVFAVNRRETQIDRFECFSSWLPERTPLVLKFAPAEGATEGKLRYHSHWSCSRGALLNGGPAVRRRRGWRNAASTPSPAVPTWSQQGLLAWRYTRAEVGDQGFPVVQEADMAEEGMEQLWGRFPPDLIGAKRQIKGTSCLAHEEILPPKLTNPHKRKATTAKDEEENEEDEEENEEGGLAAKHEDDPSELPKDEEENEEGGLAAKHEDDPSADAGSAVAKGGFRDLQPDEQSRLLTVPQCIMDEIGMHNLDPALSRAHPTHFKMLKHFFHRYLQLDTVDFYFEVEQTQQHRQRMYIAKVITPSFYDRTFCGQPNPRRDLAEESACAACLQDKEIVEASLNLPPHNGKVKRHVTNMLNGPWKKEMQARGIDPKRMRAVGWQRLTVPCARFMGPAPGDRDAAQGQPIEGMQIFSSCDLATMFFDKYSDPIYVQVEKVDVSDKNFDQV
eukprot:s1066_g11.t4